MKTGFSLCGKLHRKNPVIGLGKLLHKTLTKLEGQNDSWESNILATNNNVADEKTPGYI